jgi:EAL domain-containing protein (putative c-di-GMP-specific phosphodiesterase class I)
MGVVHQLDYQVMEKAFIEIGSTDCILFINLSPKALVLSEFVPTVVRLAKDNEVDPRRIVFELTERETVRNISLLQRFVTDLKMEGFQFAIDDFGSGFSSFHYLKHFPIDFVKIDGDFIVNLLNDERDQVFVRHMAAMANELGIRTIAEFVETEEVLREVQAAGVDLVQGYLIGRPNASAG